MMKIEKALKIVLRPISSLPPEKIKLTNGLNRVLAEDLYAGINVPQLDNSAMDGYAVKSIDLRGASKANPRTLSVICDVRAGYIAPCSVKRNQAIRIMTGAPLPQGADSVIMVENTKTPKDNRKKVEIFKEIERGKNIRRRAEDIKKGELVIRKGTLLNAGHIGLLASLGKGTIKVARRPRVAILATGDEVINVGQKLSPEKLYNSNTYTMYNQILKCGAIPKRLGIAKDKPGELERKIKRGFDCDIILTSGGVSVGDYDLVKHVLRKIGADIRFWKIAMRPGKPLTFGFIKKIPVFGLPGNPVSSMISFENFVKPTIFKMLGRNQDEKNEVEAIVEEDIKKKKGLRYFTRARVKWENGKYRAYTTGPQGSGILKSMTQANSLIILPEEKENIKKGSKVLVKFFE